MTRQLNEAKDMPLRFIGSIKDENGMHDSYGPVGPFYRKLDFATVQSLKCGTVSTVVNSHAPIWQEE